MTDKLSLSVDDKRGFRHNERAERCWKHRLSPNHSPIIGGSRMADKPIPTPEELRQLLTYDPEIGKLFWKERGPEWFADGKHSAVRSAATWNARYAGTEAFTTADRFGYRQGAIFGRTFRGHRVIWAIAHGHWPALDVDHINGDTSDNRLSNLRESTKMENSYNRGCPANNTSGFKGVFWHRKRARWGAKIQHRGRRLDLGLFVKETDAAKAYDAAARKHHGEFARVNFPHHLGGGL